MAKIKVKRLLIYFTVYAVFIIILITSTPDERIDSLFTIGGLVVLYIVIWFILKRMDKKKAEREK